MNFFTKWLEEDVLSLLQQQRVVIDYMLIQADKEVVTEIQMGYIQSLSKKERENIREELKVLIPGDGKRDPVIIARRARLTMIQILYDRGKLTLEEAREQLNGNLSPDNEETYHNDSELLYIKENNNGDKESEQE